MLHCAIVATPVEILFASTDAGHGHGAMSARLALRSRSRFSRDPAEESWVYLDAGDLLYELTGMKCLFTTRQNDIDL
jgi:hypothetical protein